MHDRSTQLRDPLEGALRSVFDEVLAELTPRREWQCFAELRPKVEAARSTQLVCVGKMSRGLMEAMLGAVDATASSRAVRGLALIPDGTARMDHPCATYLVVDHPHSTERNAAAARQVLATLRRLRGDDLLVVGLSGGASAHLALPLPEFSMKDLDALYAHLRRAGASITELNTVRKHCEAMKGGRAALETAAEVVVLVASDVLGDALDVIGSGPFCADSSTLEDCRRVLARFECAAVAPEVVARFQQDRCAVPETPKTGAACFQRVTHRVIAHNATALRACSAALGRRGIAILECIEGVAGEAGAAGKELVARLAHYAASGQRGAVLMGGEPVVDARGAPPGARGGPAQELALAAILEWRERDLGDGCVATLSTDGVDGESEAAGAIGTRQSCLSLEGFKDARRALVEHDATAFFERYGVSIRTGPTGVNLNHIAIGLLR